MKKLLTLLLAVMLMAAALPALADTDGYPDNILLDTGVAYGNYGYPGLVKLHDGDMDKVVAHMRSAKANQQGGGTGYRAAATTSASKASDLIDQMLARLASMGRADLAEFLSNELALGAEAREMMNSSIAGILAGSGKTSLSDLSDEELIDLFFEED